MFILSRSASASDISCLDGAVNILNFGFGRTGLVFMLLLLLPLLLLLIVLFVSLLFVSLSELARVSMLAKTDAGFAASSFGEPTSMILPDSITIILSYSIIVSNRCAIVMTYEKVKSDPDVLDMVLSPWTYRAKLELFSNSLLNKTISFRVNLRCSFVHQDDLVSAT